MELDSDRTERNFSRNITDRTECNFGHDFSRNISRNIVATLVTTLNLILTRKYRASAAELKSTLEEVRTYQTQFNHEGRILRDFA